MHPSLSSFSFPLKCSPKTVREKFWYFIKVSKEMEREIDSYTDYSRKFTTE